ncbi:unnamed protein product [Brachionus calyciflorus]|uniref:Apple domain-containing protein n=1 Tax=Brachionus calyciflorus TaxID=104777 RepID=A0A813QUC6_9BILA|nr:unnamed protein product [Brachionus calyciflorus]
MHKFFVFFLLNLPLILTQQQSCQFPPSSPLAPPKPELPSVFYTRIEINTNLKTSTTRQLFYDATKRKASLVDQFNNIQTNYIFDYPSNEIHILFASANQTTGSIVEGEPLSYSPIACDTFKLTESNLVNYFFGYKKINDSFIEPDTVYHALNFKGDQFYNGTTIIRGIPVDIYESCQTIPQINAQFTAIYYFTRYNYSMPSYNPEFTRIPIRAIFKGTRDENFIQTDFTDVFDFYDFRVHRSFDSVFMTPSGVVCANRKTTRQLPQIPKQYRFSEEITNQAMTKYITNLNYNDLFKAVRYQRRNPRQEEETFYSTDPLTIIHDYNIGVSFALNKYHRNCSISAISVLNFDSDKNFTNSLYDSDGSYVIRLKSPESFLLLDSDYVYTGKRFVNNVPSDVYISDRSTRNKSIISEFAFSSDDFIFHESNQIDKSIPVRLWVKENEDVSYSSFYDYDSLPQDYQSFDVSECFSDEREFDFRIKFPYKKYGLSPDQLKEDKIFKFTFSFTLIQSTNESFTRFKTPKISASSDGYLYIRSEILPQPPAISMFTALPNYWLISPSVAVLRNLTSPEECAAYCLKNLSCLSFDFGKTTLTCFLNSKHSVNGTASSMTGYVHYSRNTLNGFYSRQSYEIWNILQELVRNKQFILAVKLVDPQLPTVILEAESIELVSKNDNQFGTTQTLSKYNRKYTGKTFKTNIDREYFQLNIDDCARACNEELGFECKAFDFCYLHGDCRLSKSIPSDQPDDFFEINECDVYEKDSLYHYNEYPTKSFINKNDKQLEKVKSPSECASFCDNEKSIHCRSFNYCPDQGLCYLSERHVISDSEQGFSSDLLCSHYWRDYLADFTFTSSANIILDADLVYDGADLKQCSISCVISDGFNCKSFDYCPATKKCLLNKGLKANSTISTQNKDLCYNYRREYFYVTSQNANKKVKNLNNNLGIMIGLSIGFAFFGLFSGGVMMVVYLKKKNKL